LIIIITCIGRSRAGKIAKESVINILSIFQKGLMDMTNKVPFTPFLELGTIGSAGAGGKGGTGSKALGGTGLGSEWVVPDVRVVMVFCGMRQPTDVTGL
jgi:hypothetical protein